MDIWSWSGVGYSCWLSILLILSDVGAHARGIHYLCLCVCVYNEVCTCICVCKCMCTRTREAKSIP